MSNGRRFTDWIDVTTHSGDPTLVALHNPTLDDYGSDLIGEALDMLRTLCVPVVFAGEHAVIEYFGTVHGSHLSGRCAGEEIR